VFFLFVPLLDLNLSTFYSLLIDEPQLVHNFGLKISALALFDEINKTSIKPGKY
jgi:hypothetical protein